MSVVQEYLKTIDQVIAQGPFRAAWESLEAYEPPEWFRDAKFGIFIHWGAYCVPAFGSEWYPRNMYERTAREYVYHRAVYGPQDKFGYKDFIPQFRAERFDAARWADLFRRAGAKFVVPVAEHHDGFAMYDTSLSRWCAARMGPKRDVIGELAGGVRKDGLVFGLSSHRAEHWWFFNGGKTFPSDVQDPEFNDLYGPAQPGGTQPDEAFLNDWLVRTCELVDKFRPLLVYFDWWIQEPAFKPFLQKFAAYYYNRAAEWRQGVVINFKNDAFPEKAAIFDIERGQVDAIRPTCWQTDTSVSKNSWGYISHHDYKSSVAVIGDLVDIVSKNGSLLLNVGPRPDGTFPAPEERLLLDVGRWLEVNGEAVYGTRPWKIFGEGVTQVVAGAFNDAKRKPFTAADVRFTTKGGALYAIVLGWPESGAVTIRSLAEQPAADIRMLGCEAPIQWSREAGGLTIRFPQEKPCEHAFVFKIAGK